MIDEVRRLVLRRWDAGRENAGARLGRRAKTALREIVESLSGSVMVRRPPHGFSSFHDLKRRKPDMDIVIDVGANVGQTAAGLVETWPGAAVYCIEPFARTFEILQRNTAQDPRIRCFHSAFAAEPGQASVVLSRGSVNNSLLNEVVSPDELEASETITLTTVDLFCRDQNIDHIDFLKIDTEGFDLEVLEGAKAMLSAQCVSFIQVEAGMTRYNTKHAPFWDLYEFLDKAGYVLFGIYDQTPEWNGKARLRFSNPIFVAETEMALPAIDIPLSSVPMPRRLR